MVTYIYRQEGVYIMSKNSSKNETKNKSTNYSNNQSTDKASNQSSDQSSQDCLKKMDKSKGSSSNSYNEFDD